MKSFMRLGLSCLFLIVLGFTGFAQVGTITTVVGNGSLGYSGDTGDATMAQLNYPYGVAIDSAGNLFVADTYNHVIRKIDTLGIITTVAGNGTQGYGGDDGPATSAQLNFPYGIAVDSAGNLYIADTYNHRIRIVYASSGIITTAAGDGSLGYSGDDGVAILAQLNYPNAVAVDLAGNIFISDSDNHCIREVFSSTGIITTVAGNGLLGYSGDDGLATSARLNYPGGVAVDFAGNLYIADTFNNCVRRVTSSGVITTVAGNGLPGYGGDGAQATAAQLLYPKGIAIDAAYNLFIADQLNSCIRKVNSSGIISTVAGIGVAGYGGDGGSATSAMLGFANGVAVDSLGNFYIADTANSRIRKVSPEPSPSETSIYFPQVAIGGSWFTSFALTNTSSTLLTGNLTLADNQGNPLMASISSLGAGSSFPISILPGGTMFLTANPISPDDPAKIGWAKVEISTGSLNGVATYQSVSGGVVLTATGVLSSQPTQFATIPVDENVSQNRKVAYAIANQTNQVQLISIALVNLDGIVVDDTKVFVLDPGEQLARYFDQDYTNRPVFQGSLVLRSQGGAFIAVSFIQNEQFFTAIPVIPSKAPNIPN